MNNILIFSKDRPMQLDCLLRSLVKNAPKPDSLTVIYKATNDEYKQGYGEIVGVNMVEETNFKQNVLDAMKGDYTLLLCDDDIVFKPMKFETFADPMACFSYRLGLNIDFCYPYNKGIKLRDAIKEGPGLIMWDWRGQDFDFSYPLSVTGHMFRTDMIRTLTEKCEFINPNTYEAALQNYTSYLPNTMIAYDDSRVVGVPANRVNDAFPNRNGLVHSYTTKDLNDRFLKGERIDFEDMVFNIHSAQQELEYKFR